jgi:hypothetical protein
MRNTRSEVSSTNDVRPYFPIAASLAIVFGSPFIGELRGAIQDALPSQYRLILGAIVAVVGATGAALRRIRERRLIRYACLCASVLFGVVYAWATATGVPDRDAVERFHLVEYGLLTLLYHRAWRASGDLGSLALPAVAVMLTGFADEWVQWFVPSRVGELHDVVINAAAIVCGLLFSVGVDQEPPLRSRMGSVQRRRLGLALASLVVVTTAFVHTVHLGFEIDDAVAGTFRSRWTQASLEQARDEHARSWNGVLPDYAPLLSRENQYLAEALWHLRRRNDATAANDWARAVLENRIVERFFTPALNYPGLRWPSDQQADIEGRASALPPVRVSDADGVPVYLIDWRALWGVALAIAGAIIWWGRLNHRRASSSTSSTAASII